MFNVREVLTSLFSYISSWLQFDKIKYDYRSTSQLNVQTSLCSDLLAPCVLTLFVVHKEHDRKGNKCRDISPLKARSPAESAPCLPCNQIFLCFFDFPFKQDLVIMVGYARTKQTDIWKWCVCMTISLFQRVPKSKASQKSMENTRSLLMSRRGQVLTAYRKMKIGLWAYRFFIYFTLFTVILYVPLPVQMSCSHLSILSLLTAVEVSLNS